MRSIPKTPAAQIVWLVGILAVLVMIAGHPVAGLVVMALAAVVGLALRAIGVR